MISFIWSCVTGIQPCWSHLYKCRFSWPRHAKNYETNWFRVCILILTWALSRCWLSTSFFFTFIWNCIAASWCCCRHAASLVDTYRKVTSSVVKCRKHFGAFGMKYTRPPTRWQQCYLFDRYCDKYRIKHNIFLYLMQINIYYKYNMLTTVYITRQLIVNNNWGNHSH